MKTYKPVSCGGGPIRCIDFNLIAECSTKQLILGFLPLLTLGGIAVFGLLRMYGIL
jgi:hypothetical protein